MYTIDILFTLVNSMTKSEKRYFRMMADLQKGEKNYLALFNCLDKAEVFDSILQKELSKLFPGTSIEPARKHLYRVLIKSLRQFESENDIEMKLMTLLQDSRILYNKGLQTQSFEQLYKAKELALKSEKFMYFILAARQEMQYLVRTQFKDINEDELIEKQEKIRTLLEHENNASQHAMLYEVLLLRYWKTGVTRNQQAITKLNDVLLEEYQILNAQRFQSFESQQLHLHFQSIYFLMTGNPAGSLTVFHDLDKLFQQHQHLWVNAPLYYVQLLDGILYDLRWMERYDDMPIFIKKLSAIPAHTEGQFLVIKYLVLQHEIQAATDQKKIDEALKIIQDCQPVFDRETAQLSLHTRTQLEFAIGRTWFVSGEYSKALKQVNKILNQPADTLYQPLYVLARLMNLQINASLKNTDHLTYAIRSIERKLKAEQKMYAVEKLILSYLKKWLALKPLSKLDSQLKDLHQNPIERQLMKELNITEWVEQIKTVKLV